MSEAWAQRRERLRRSLPGRAALRAASYAYGAGVLGRRLLYDLKVLKRRRLDARVLCIGNLTAGGTGKTPAVLLAAETLRKKGHKVAVLSRGYGRTAPRTEVTVLLDDRRTDWRTCGDEPWVIHQALKGLGVPVLVCPDRVKAGDLAIEMYGARVLILDDGFQHLRLERDLDVVLVNARDPFGGRRLLPAGDLREPAAGLRRAQLVVVTHADAAEPGALSALRGELEALHPDAPVLESAHRADYVLDVRTEEKLPVDHLKGKSVVALSGIGDPLSFESHIKDLGASVAQSWRYPDHHPYGDAELRSVESLRAGLPVVTTFKDFARLPERWRDVLKGQVLVLGVKLEITKGKTHWAETLDRLAKGADKA